MEENNNEQEIISNYLSSKKDETAKLLEDLAKTKETYESILQNITQSKEKIENQINELTENKDNFINETNVNITSYQEKFTKLNLEIDAIKNQIIEKQEELINKNNAIILDYETKAKENITLLEKRADAVNDFLEEEKESFETLCLKTKADFTQKSTEFSTLITQYNTQSAESIIKIKANLEDSDKNSAKIRQTQAEVEAFKENIDEYVENMQETTKNIIEKTNTFEKDTRELIDKNIKLTIEIEEQLSKATGASLFHMFQNRKEQLEKNQGWWLAGVLVTVGVLIWFSCWIISSIKAMPPEGSIDWFKDAIFKFTLSTPAIYLLYFLADRYTKLRRLIEEYAFKSAISLALTPYFDLVKRLDGKTEGKDKDFLIAVIGNIFKTPTDKVFKTKEGHYDLDFSNYYKNIASIIIPEPKEEKTS